MLSSLSLYCRLGTVNHHSHVSGIRTFSYIYAEYGYPDNICHSPHHSWIHLQIPNFPHIISDLSRVWIGIWQFRLVSSWFPGGYIPLHITGIL